jgi:CMP/dCMP kinase
MIKLNKSSVIAIDGPAGSGKSSVAAMVAQQLDAPYVNTGSMYRAITLFLQKSGVNTASVEDQDVNSYLEKIHISYEKNPNGEWDIKLNGEFPGEALRTPRVADAVSTVAALPSVRTFLMQIQHASAELGTIVMEGRDIGTVIFPNAHWKFFLWATPEERAKRRLDQDRVKFADITLEQVIANITERDRIDSTRAVAPLRQADDAEKVDTTGMTLNEVVDYIVSRVKG